MSKEKCERGKHIRKEMFGQVMPQQSPFRQPFEELVNAYCFGEIWDRPCLPRKTRSMLTIAILTAMSRPTQLQAHIKGAIANGCSKEEIMEVIMHSSIYAGIPAGADSFHQATIALKDIGME